MAKMIKLCFGMKKLNVTQSSGGNFSHPNFCLDLAGSDSGIDFWFAMGDYWKCTGGPWGSNTYFFTACDASGRPVKVKLANGRETVITIALTHAAFKYVARPVIGKIYKNGEPFYEEGTVGNATGNHIHVEVAAGLHTSKVKDNTTGVYRMTDELTPEEVFYILKDFTKIINSGNIKWKETDSIYEY